MSIPGLKRIRVATAQALRVWLERHPGHGAGHGTEVMVVSDPGQISAAQIAEVAQAQGWVSGMRYTLNGGQVGHVITRAQD